MYTLVLLVDPDLLFKVKDKTKFKPKELMFVFASMPLGSDFCDLDLFQLQGHIVMVTLSCHWTIHNEI